MMNRNEELNLGFFMSRIRLIEDIKETEKTKLSIVYYEATRTTCILRVCKNRNLSTVCDALLQVKNPNVALVYQYVYAGGNTYIIEEMLSGKTLEEIIMEDGLFSEYDTAKIISAVCSGLGDFHKMQPPVIHNDINTSNIMICDDSGVKLFDFDISRTYKKDSRQNTELFGTEEYASPEHFGYGQSEPRTDIYSLGVTMHRMLCGRYLSDNRKCLYEGRMKKIIQRCIAIDPKKRYASVQHLQKDLEKILNRKKTAFKLIAVLCAVAVLCTVGILLFGKNGEKQSAPESPSVTQSHSLSKTTSETSEIITTASEDTLINNEVKKVNVAQRLEGELLSMVAMNDGTMVYLEKTSDELQVKSSSGACKILPTELYNKSCELLYNAYTDSLYLVSADGMQSNIYSLNNTLEADSSPVYSGSPYYTSNIKGVFFSDGLMYCNAFSKELIDTNKWSAVEDANVTPDAVINDCIYSFNTNDYMLNELNFNGEEINSYEIPGEILFNRAYSEWEEKIYLTVSVNKKSYVYAFDGEAFNEFVCLSDYKYYTDFEFSFMAVTENKIWMYDEDTNAIKEFTI